MTEGMEMSVLGALLRPDTARVVLSTATEEHFAVDFHKKLYASARDMSRRGHEITPESLSVALQVDHSASPEDAFRWVGTLSEGAPTDMRSVRYVLEALGRARIQVLTKELGSSLVSGSYEPLDRSLAKLTAFQRAISSLDENAARTYREAFLELSKATRRLPYLTPGMGLLDRAVKFYPGSINYIGANSGGGKTSWLLNALWNMAANGHQVGLISIEMTRPQLAARWSGLLAGLNTMRVKDQELQDNERRVMQEAIEHRHGTISRIHGIEPARFDVDLVKPTIDKWVNDMGVELVGIDYVQRLKANHKNIRTETDRVSYASEALTEAAKMTGIPIVALSQLRRRSGEEAGMSDFKQSGQLEHDGQFMATITPAEGGLPGSDVRKVYFKVVKQRDGLLIEDELDYHLPTQIFRHSGATHDGHRQPDTKKPTRF